ncbi:MAG: response regulator [Alphaproteobacteria bacterium]|nr:response regulator [Alphaproteobacteria bacterium]MDE2011657.1 response regulator transcription factor [Alphaproteobacteria bacterium]MDE2074684.1 response regulator transcription factor [Alphaproteobacteria bacterium]MDE2352322.1 response regulator transcription factor [Alphaproteobacteria bacterium]
MAAQPTIFIVDDDEAVRGSLEALLESHGFGVEVFDSADAFLRSEALTRTGCLIADIRLPGMDGLALQEELVRRGTRLQVIVVTGFGDVPLAVRAMKSGAIDFLEKPYDEGVLLSAVRRALEAARAASQAADAAHEVEVRFASLTERERQVLDLLAAGRPNKVIAYELDISPRTVEIHRARVMEKMGARNLAELVRMVVAADVGSDVLPESE